MVLMAAQADIFDTLREVAAFSREVEEQNFRGGPPSERSQLLPCLLPALGALADFAAANIRHVLCRGQ